VAVEEIRSARRSSALRLLDERHDKLVQLVGLAMIGVERNEDRVAVGGSVNMLGDRDCAEHDVLDSASRRKRCTSD
jgi:hypothetical protein